MNDEFQPERINIAPSMIIALALIMGVAVFGTVALMMKQGEAAPEELGLIPIVMAGVGAMGLLASIVMPGFIATAQIRNLKDAGETLDTTRLVEVFQLRMISRLALLEGGAFANLIGYMVEGNPVSLYVAGSLVLMMVTQFPTPGRIEDWVRHQQELLELER